MSLDTAAQRRKTAPAVTAVAGGLAGLTSRFVIAPLDVVKIRLQLQSRPGTTYNGAIHAARTIVAQEGLTALWKGNIPAELLYVSYSMVQFVMYREAHVILEKADYPKRYRSFVAGASAGMCATVVTYPLDLLRTRFAAQGTSKVHHSGLHHLYRYIHRCGNRSQISFVRRVSRDTIEELSRPSYRSLPTWAFSLARMKRAAPL